MTTKTSQAIALFVSGNISEALKIFKTFRVGFTKEENRIITIAYEGQTGRESFYQCIGINISDMNEQAKEIIKTKYNL